MRQAKLIQAMQVGILHGKVEPDHPERNPAGQEVTNVVKPGEKRQQAVIRKGEGEWSRNVRVTSARTSASVEGNTALGGRGRGQRWLVGIASHGMLDIVDVWEAGRPYVLHLEVVGRHKWEHPRGRPKEHRESDDSIAGEGLWEAIVVLRAPTKGVTGIRICGRRVDRTAGSTESMTGLHG